MVENREQAIQFVIVQEGYIANVKNDPGGLTIFGISSRYFPSDVEAMKTMDRATAEEYARNFYRKLWGKNLCDHHQFPLDIIFFDCCVIPGPRAAKGLMKLSNDWKDLLFERLRYYQKARNRKWDGVGGWVNRTCDLFLLAKQGGAV